MELFIESSRGDLKLKPYQLEGVKLLTKFLAEKSFAILADEPGLGKTCQSIAVFNVLNAIKKQEVRLTALIVCPKVACHVWVDEFRLWSRLNLKVIMVTKPSDLVDIDRADIVIVSYNRLPDKFVMSAILMKSFSIVIADEAHYLKSCRLQQKGSAKRSYAFKIIANKIPYVLLVTGTPIQNRPIEMYGLLVAGGGFEATDLPRDYMRFAKRYCNAKKGFFGWDVSGSSNEGELNKKLSSIMVRRLKSDVIKELPPKTYCVVPLDEDAATTRIAKKIENLGFIDVSKPEKLMVGEIATLRREQALAKLDDTIKFIENILEQKEKVVVFAYHREVIWALVARLEDYAPVIITGDSTHVQRINCIIGFQECNNRIFIGQIQAAGVAITLTAADTVIFVETTWVPGEIEQAVDRCHRIGQQNNVTAYFLTVKNSLDEKMLNTIIGKQLTINKII